MTSRERHGHALARSTARALRASCVLVVAGSLAVLAQVQTTRPSFKTGIGLVRLDVSVLDSKRQPIRGLQTSDFMVLEDGTPRPIRLFEAVDLPPRRPPSATGNEEADAGSQVVTNEVGDQDGRLVFILMDRTIPTGQPVLAAKRIASAAIDALGPTDLAAVVTTGGNVPQTLTADRARLHRAVNQGDWSAIPSPEQQEIIGKYDPFSDGRCLCGLCVLETVTNIADAVRGATLRNKLLLFVGSSIIVQTGPRAPSADVGCDSRLDDARRTMFDALARSHLTVHSIDPSGLGTPMCQGSCNGKAGQDGQVVRRQKLQDETVQRMQELGSLGILPERTGGRVVENTNAAEEKIPDIFHESDTYYILAYEPAEPSSKKALRSVEVKVARRGAHVTTSRFAPPSSGAPVGRRPSGSKPPITPLDLALAGLLPEARVPLAMSVAAFAAAVGAKDYVGISLDAAGFNAVAAIGAPLDVALTVLDQRGRRVTFARGTGSTALPGDLQTHVLLAPGDYELRVAIEPRRTETAASVFSQFSVPSFAEAPLSMSDLVIGTRENTDPPADSATPLIPIIPSTTRTFHGTDTAWAFVEVYQGTQKSDALQAIAVRTTIVDATGRGVHGYSQTLDAAAFVGRRAGVRIRLPLDALSPGTYALRIEAARGARTASRRVAFAIE